MKKYLVPFFLISILLTSCDLTSQDKVAGNYPMLKLANYAVQGSPETTYEMVQRFQLEQNLLSKTGKELVFNKADETTTDSEGYLLTDVYKDGKDTYKLIDINRVKTDTIAEEYAITKNGKEIYRSKMCYGAEGPIQDVRNIDGKVAFTFVEGSCNYDGKAETQSRMNIFYDGKTINDVYGVNESHFLFSYKGKLGFVTKIEGKEYIYFNGKKASSAFDSIPTHQCCDSPESILKVYDNGAFLFRGSIDKDYYLEEVDLNKFL